MLTGKKKQKGAHCKGVFTPRKWAQYLMASESVSVHFCIMVCFHCPIPTPRPTLMQMAIIVICRTVSTEPTPIPIVIPFLIPMATVPNLAPILVPIRRNVSSFHSNCP